MQVIEYEIVSQGKQSCGYKNDDNHRKNLFTSHAERDGASALTVVK